MSRNNGVVPEKEELQSLSKDDVVREKKKCAFNEGKLKTTSEESKNESYTTITTEPGTIALRTIPTNGNKRLQCMYCWMMLVPKLRCGSRTWSARTVTKGQC